MSVFLMQTILAARNRNIEDSGWMQILFLIAMAVFWILGAMKAKSRKKEESEEQESMPMHRAHARPPASGRGGQQKKLSPQQHRAYVAWQQQQSQKQPKQQKRTITRPQPSVQKTTALKPRVAKKLGIMRGLDVGDLVPEEALELEAPKHSVGGSSPGEGRHAAQADELALLAGLRSDYADPEQLRRAIVHCEILGKPLSLRPPGEQMMG